MGRPTAFVKVLQAPPREPGFLGPWYRNCIGKVFEVYTDHQAAYPLVNPKKHLCPGIGYGEIAISDAQIVERL